MTNEKNVGLGDELESQEEDLTHDSSNRARNRTVMLTPEITGQVRQMLADEMAKGGEPVPAAPASQPALGSTYSPAGVSSGVPTYDPLTDMPPASSASMDFQPPQPAMQPPPAQHVAPRPTPAKLTPIVGFMVSYDEDANGEVYELRSGRWIVSSEQTTGGNFILINNSTISPLHAIIRVSSSGEIQVLDQLSEFGTGITKIDSEQEEELTGSMSSVEHGDVLRFGERKFSVCLVQRFEDEDEGE